MSTISVKQALNYGINELRNAGIDSAHLDAEILFCFVLGCKKEDLIANPKKLQVTSYKLKRFKKLISKRKKHWPIAYLTNHKEFYGIDFYVNKDVLVPRPETELIIDSVLEYCRGGVTPPGRGNPTYRPGRRAPTAILEIGTGSGCISLVLGKYLPDSKITAVDISEKALKIAHRNLRNFQFPISPSTPSSGPRGNIQFKHSNLLSNIKSQPDILIANLPYLTKKELKEPSIYYEPKKALYGGRDGLEVYNKLLKQVKNKFIDNGSQLTIFFEINPSQKNKIVKLAKKHLPKSKIEVKKDLSGRDRLVIIKNDY